MVDAGPFELGRIGGSGPAVLCLHGLTGTPYEVRHPAEALAAHGFACMGPALAGHCTTPEELAGTSGRRWLEDARHHYERLASTHERVYVLGLSMGGVVALWLCTERPVSGAIILAAPLQLGRMVRLGIPILAPLLGSLPKTPDIVDDQARERHPGYDRMPLAAVRELMKLQRALEPRLDRVTAPLRLVYSRSDRTVRLADAERILSRVSSEDTGLRVLSRSGHVLPVDVERGEVAREAVDFLVGLETAAHVDDAAPGALESSHTQHRSGA